MNKFDIGDLVLLQGSTIPLQVIYFCKLQDAYHYSLVAPAQLNICYNNNDIFSVRTETTAREDYLIPYVNKKLEELYGKD